MDTSEIYQKMCDCEEIQKAWTQHKTILNIFFVKSGYYSNGAEPCNGEYWVDEGEIVYCGGNDYISGDDLKNYIWLPLQDQIQEMVEIENMIPLASFFRFVENGRGYWHGFERAPLPHPSLEQLWLVFYMWEKHQKIWTGEKWEKA